MPAGTCAPVSGKSAVSKSIGSMLKPDFMYRGFKAEAPKKLLLGQ